jgi:L-lactate dehydrogenase complex protein LldE
MKVGLVVPCYIDTFYPEVGIATLELLERLGVEVEYPFDQTCCGQPMANSGCEEDSRATEEHFVRLFSRFEYIVVPSGSCTHHIRNKFRWTGRTPGAGSHDSDGRPLASRVTTCRYPRIEIPHARRSWV